MPILAQVPGGGSMGSMFLVFSLLFIFYAVYLRLTRSVKIMKIKRWWRSQSTDANVKFIVSDRKGKSGKLLKIRDVDYFVRLENGDYEICGTYFLYSPGMVSFISAYFILFFVNFILELSISVFIPGIILMIVLDSIFRYMFKCNFKLLISKSETASHDDETKEMAFKFNIEKERWISFVLYKDDYEEIRNYLGNKSFEHLGRGNRNTTFMFLFGLFTLVLSLLSFLRA